jgi:hypothetical protein
MGKSRGRLPLPPWRSRSPAGRGRDVDWSEISMRVWVRPDRVVIGEGRRGGQKNKGQGVLALAPFRQIASAFRYLDL